MSLVLIVVAGTAFLLISSVSLLTWRSARMLRRQVAELAARDESVPNQFAEAIDNEQLVEAFRALSDGLVIVDRDGEVVLRNAAAARFHGARHADALAEQAIDEVARAALRGDPVERELQLYGPPPETLRLRAVPLRRGSVVIGAVASIHDVSEAHRIDSVRRDFVANVSHELKTPIGALALLADTLVDGVDGADPDVMRHLAGRVVGEADRLGRIVDDLLDLSLIEAEEGSERNSTSVAGVVGEAVERVRPAAEVNGVAIHVEEIGAEAVIVCDRRRVVGALTSLLDNALKYSDAPASIEVEATHEQGQIAITVRDYGIGIPTRDLERIFERFYRVDRARSRDTGGTGLGLAIVRHVARTHGGEVTVESREGEGSTFRFMIPDQPLRAVPGVAEAS